MKDTISEMNASEADVLQLDPPKPVPTITPAQAKTATASMEIINEEKTKLDIQVSGAVKNLMHMEIHGDDFRRTIENVANVGNKEIQQSASVSNRLLDKPVRAMKEGGISETGKVSKDLLSLRRAIEKVDPSKTGLLTGSKKLLNFIPFKLGTKMGNKVVDVYHSYQSSKTQIDAIVMSLYSGRDDLQRDIASIDEEKANLWATMERLKKFAYIAEKIDDELSQNINNIKMTDPQRAKILQEEVLFRLRQKRQDLATSMAVSVQGYMTLDLVRRNDIELVMGVERAATTTVGALRIAVMAAQALSDQKDVMNQISGLNKTTNNVILQTSEMLRNNSGEIASMASKPTVDVDTLRKAFDNVYQAFDTVDNYKIRALEAMKQTVDGLQVQIDRSKEYVDRERQKVLETSATAMEKTPALTVE